MKSSIKALCIASLLATVLSACGGGSGSGEPVATDDPTPVVPEQPVVAQEPQDLQGPQEHQEPVAPQEPVTPPLPVANQTGWTIGPVESRKPLELLKAAMCVERAERESVALPVSSEACSVAFPDLVSGGEQRLVDEMASPGYVGEKREGCTYIAESTALVCGWQFATEDSRGTNGIVNYWFDLPFMPSFSSEIAACEDGKDHWVNMNLARGSDTGDRVVKDRYIPSGCMGWEGLIQIFEGTEIGLHDDMPPA